MENASKALIIAGAILLSILIITLGIMIYSKAQDTINNSGMSQAEVQAFNEKFTKYAGTQKGSSIRSLLQEVVTSNGDEGNQANENRQIQVTFEGNIKTKLASTTINNVNVYTNLTGMNDIKNTKNYTVDYTYASDGHISTITIAEQ